MAARDALLLLCTLIVVCAGNSLKGKIDELEEKIVLHDENWNQTAEELESLKETILALVKRMSTSPGNVAEISDKEVNININVPTCDCNKTNHGSLGIPGPPGPPGPPGQSTTNDSPVRADKQGSPLEPARGGVVYTRWGRTACGNASSLLYSGYAGGSRYDQPGGGVNYQCMPDTPEYNSAGTVTEGDFMAGVEYESSHFGPFPDEAQNNNAPCAVCYTNNRPALLMIPAKRTCLNGWTKEYEGYLMTDKFNGQHQSTFECVDAHPEYIRGGGANTDGGLFHFTRSECSKGSYCPPYHSSKAITCVVCTK